MKLRRSLLLWHGKGIDHMADIEKQHESSDESQGASRRGSTSRSRSSETEHDPMKRTAGAPSDARAVSSAEDLPLSVGPRDALVIDGHNDGDYVPDAEGKGYHVGMLRQPVMALVDKGGRIVGFEAVNESKFAVPGSLASLKEFHNDQEADWKEGQHFRSAAPEPKARAASR